MFDTLDCVRADASWRLDRAMALVESVLRSGWGTALRRVVAVTWIGALVHFQASLWLFPVPADACGCDPLMTWVERGPTSPDDPVGVADMVPWGFPLRILAAAVKVTAVLGPLAAWALVGAGMVRRRTGVLSTATGTASLLLLAAVAGPTLGPRFSSILLELLLFSLAAVGAFCGAPGRRTAC